MQLTKRQTGRAAVSVWIWAAVLLLGFLTLYLATPTSNHTFDAVSYAQSIRQSEKIGLNPLFHPHHLLFNAAGLMCWRLLRVHYPQMDPLGALQVMNAFAGALGLMAMFLLLRKLTCDVSPEGKDRRGSIRIAAASTIALGFAFAWWVASTDGRVNIVPMVPLLAAFYLAYRTARSGRAWTAAALGLVVGITTLFHQSHGMFLLTALAAAFLAPVKTARKATLAGIILATFSLAVAVPYAIVIRLHGINTFGGAFDWMTTYARMGIWWDFDVLGNLDQDLSAQRHAFMADIPRHAAMLQIAAAAAAHAVILFALGVVAFGLFDRAANIYRERKHRTRRIKMRAFDDVIRKSITRGPRCFSRLFTINVLLGVWIISYASFFTVWSPGYFIFWLPVISAIFILVTVNASTGSGRRFVAPTAALASVLLFATNLYLYILPNMPTQRNGTIVVARKVRQLTPSNALVIIDGMGDLAQLEVYIPYFAERDTISVHQVMSRQGEQGPKWLRHLVNQKLRSGDPVYVFGEVYDSPMAWRQLTKRYGPSAVSVRKMLQSFPAEMRFRASDQPVYKLSLRQPSTR